MYICNDIWGVITEYLNPLDVCMLQIAYKRNDVDINNALLQLKKECKYLKQSYIERFIDYYKDDIENFCKINKCNLVYLLYNNFVVMKKMLKKYKKCKSLIEYKNIVDNNEFTYYVCNQLADIRSKYLMSMINVKIVEDILISTEDKDKLEYLWKLLKCKIDIKEQKYEGVRFILNNNNIPYRIKCF